MRRGKIGEILQIQAALVLEFRTHSDRHNQAMLDNDFLKSLSQRLTAMLPMAAELREEIRTKIEQQLQTSFAKLDLLTRSDFDSQTAALERAEQRVAELEALLVNLDARLAAIEAKHPDGE